MIDLDSSELAQVGGADINGALWGALDGATTGGFIAAKYSGAGGLGFGAIGQLVGVLMGEAGGAATGLLMGAMSNQPCMAAYWSDFRHTFGSAADSRSYGSI